MLTVAMMVAIGVALVGCGGGSNNNAANFDAAHEALREAGFTITGPVEASNQRSITGVDSEFRGVTVWYYGSNSLFNVGRDAARLTAAPQVAYSNGRIIVTGNPEAVRIALDAMEGNATRIN